MVQVQDLGEKAFIRDVLSGHAKTAHADALEDCVVIDPARLSTCAGAPLIVYSIDHPSQIDRPVPAGFEWQFHGRWLAACTCNDVLAMGGQPCGFSLDLALPAETEIDVVKQLYRGVEDVLHEYGAVFEGGNTDVNTRLGTVALCWGTVPRAGIVRRRGARPGDYIAVTTELGVGWASYLIRKKDRRDRLSPRGRDELDGYNLMPLAPHRAIVETANRLPGAITSGMDLSDGLAEFVHAIGETTGLGAEIEQARVPCSPLLAECAAVLDVPAPALAIEYGYDTPRAHGYTIAPQRWSEVAEVFARCGSPLYRLGQVTAEPGVFWLPSAGQRQPLPRLWDDKCWRDDAIASWESMVERQIW